MTKRLSLLLSIASYLPAAWGADLSDLVKGQHVSIVMIGQGPLCEAIVEQQLFDGVKLRLRQTTTECGRKGESLRIANDRVSEVVKKERLTKKRVAAKLLLGAAGVAALAAVPLSGSDPDGWLLLGNYVIPGFVMYGAWKVVPRRQDYLLLMTCTDRLRCVGHAD